MRRNGSGHFAALFQRKRAIEARKQERLIRRIENLERELDEATHPSIRHALAVQIGKLKRDRHAVKGS